MDITQIIIQLLNLTLMFSVGISLNNQAFFKYLKNYKLLLLASLINFIIIPLGGIVLGLIFKLDNSTYNGFLLCMIAAGGATGLLITQLSHGSLELATILLFFCNIMNFIAVPVLTRFFLKDVNSNQQLTLTSILHALFIYQLIPLLLGVIARKIKKHRKMLFKATSLSANILFALLLIGLIITKGRHFLEFSVLDILCFVVGTLFILSTHLLLFPLTHQEKNAFTSIAIMRNLSLSLLLSEVYFKDTKITLSILTFGFFLYFFSVIWALVLRKL